MKKFILFVIFCIASSHQLTAKTKPIKGVGLSYAEGLTEEKVNIANLRSNFSGNGKLRIFDYRLSGFIRHKWWVFPEIEYTGNLNYFTYSLNGTINGKCYTGIGPSLEIGGSGFINIRGGKIYCGPRQSSLYILDTTEPKLNPYDSEIIKDFGAIVLNFEGTGKKSKYGLRLFYELQDHYLKIFYSNNTSLIKFRSRMYGIRIFKKIGFF